MLKKFIIAVAAVAAIGAFSPSLALARGGGGGHGGGFGGGGFHGGGFGGGGFRSGGFAGVNGARSFAAVPGARFAGVQGHGTGHFGHGRHGHYRHFSPFFAGFGGPYYGYGDNYYYDDYADGYPYGNNCYELQRVHTRYGWRWQRVDVCS